MPPALIACAHCGCHARSTETDCPSCGEPMRRRDGTIPRTAAALLLGLTTAAVPAIASGCSGGGDPVPAYGIAVTVGSSGTGMGGAGGAGGGTAPAYGVALTSSSSSGGGAAPAYGIPMTTGAGGNDAG